MMKNVKNNLYIGDHDSGEDVEELAEEGIDTIVNLSGKCSWSVTKHYDMVHLPIADGEECTSHQFERAVVNAAYEVKEGKNVLIHCAAGQSRSVAVAATVLSLLDEIPYLAGLEVVKDVHPGASPHPIFKDRAENFLERNGMDAV